MTCNPAPCASMVNANSSAPCLISESPEEPYDVVAHILGL